MPKRYHIRLSNDDRHSLQKLIRSGNAPARALTHARILLKADEADDGPAWQAEQICLPDRKLRVVPPASVSPRGLARCGGDQSSSSS